MHLLCLYFPHVLEKNYVMRLWRLLVIFNVSKFWTHILVARFTNDDLLLEDGV